MNLRKAPGGMDLVSMRQAHELRPSGRSAGVEECAYGLAICRRLEFENVRRTCNRLIEAQKVANRAAILAKHENRSE
ncbi:hypothetical protein ACVWW7_004409 [Bradyrhizobium sp. LM6.9]